MIELACIQCGKLFFSKLSHAHRRKFCSYRCYWRSLVIKKPERTCITCGKKFIQKRHEGDGKNCSVECQRKAATQQIPRVCIQCGADFTVNTYQVKQGWGQFCSRTCHGKWKSENLVGENSPSWQGGISFEPYCPKFNKRFKERVRAFFDYRCLECEMTQEENGRRLDVHHVNYDKQVCCNGNKPLFAALCRFHNPTANKNRAEWEQHFTDIINEKYGGKCYFTKDEMKARQCEV